MKKKYIVRLTEEERAALEKLVRTGKAAAYTRLRAQVLLKADRGAHGPGWNDQRIADAFNVSICTVGRVRKRLVMHGLDAALKRERGAGRKPKFTGEHEAHLVALACSEPPEGRGCWTLRLLADQMVRLEYTDNISYDTVRRILKKTKLNRG